MSQGVPRHLGVSQGLFGQKWFFLMEPPYSGNHPQVPAQKFGPCTISLRKTDIASVEWAATYPGCKLLIKLKSHTFPSAEQYQTISHLIVLTKGDKIIFDGYDPGFQYEFTRLLLSTGDRYHVEIVAFNKKGEYFTEASSAFFPCVLEIPAHLIDPHAFDLPTQKPRSRRAHHLNASDPA